MTGSPATIDESAPATVTGPGAWHEGVSSMQAQATAKRCPKCGETKPSIGFNRDKARADGRDCWCKTCRAERTRAWVAANPERHATTKIGDPVAHNERSKRWKRANPERAAEHRRRAREKYRAARPQEYLAAKRLGASIRRFRGPGRRAAIDYAVIVTADPCAYCGGPGGTLDHITAVKNGGENEWHNLTGACLSCNSSKGTHSLLFALARRNQDFHR